MKTIGVAVNKDKKLGPILLEKIMEKARDYDFLLKNRYLVSGECGIVEIAEIEEKTEKIDLVLVLGGDGTILCATRYFAPKDIPILGINLGQLGYLSELDPQEIDFGLQKIRAGEYLVEDRTMLEAKVRRAKQEVAVFHGLNDGVLTKGAFARIINFAVFVDEQYITEYAADGVIVATPTGSTAYSLSAGGAILDPEVKAFIITPICPHTLAARSLVVADDKEIKIVVKTALESSMLTVDGQQGFGIKPGDEIIIKKAPYRAKFIKLKNRSFYQLLREKMREANRYHD
ncbi:NAD(+) kinase [Carboxydothermus islandicus]|uniref:NAD kinase n=1 Tax=Carboxydothermus islandicus TaxID=661089 RepID=A0A1L8D3A8_9THEO|nr:NAD(+)/NADH kinase [Carboxydothermus islandicus]GAV25649.1 NAD(+) kinase [Carboxydothermus islandicus]